MDVVIVESPAKAKTINKYLGKNFEVYASYGHIRDLPSKDGSVDPDDDFAMIWDVDTKSAQRMSAIAKAVKGADRVILATDPDREGEAISWHVLEVLKAKKVLKDVKVDRVTFNAITKTAVTEAMAKPREIDAALVDAYLARRALDYLVGFTLSPVLWRKLPGARSAGRVQSVTLAHHLRPRARDRKIRPPGILVARRTFEDEGRRRLPRPPRRRRREKLGRLDIKTEADAKALQAALEAGHYAVTKVEAKPARRNPYPPFTTSTMQQEASRKLGFTPNRTMQLAQRLYEGVEIGGETIGLITYMRTDGVDMAPEAVHGARRVIHQVRRPLRAEAAAPLHGEGEERAGGARGDPPDRDVAPAQAGGARARSGDAEALRADLDAHGREPDGIRRPRAHGGRHPSPMRRAASSTCAPTARSSSSTAS